MTREPGYLLRVGPDELDLLRFERLAAAAQGSPPDQASRLLREALGLWRGSPLPDLADDTFAQPVICRLEELRVGALEERIEADLELGRHAELVGELQGLVREHPLRERLRASLMQALYGSGRQAEALDVYRQARTMLRDELGLDPGPALQELEQAILRQDPALSAAEAPSRRRAILLVASGTDGLDRLLAVAEPLCRQPARELILTRLLSEAGELAAANATLAERRASLADRGVAARVAVYTTPDPGGEAALLATQHDVDLILADAPAVAETGLLGDELTAILANTPCDVGLLVGSGRAPSGPVVTPFSGAEHDWSAIELAAWLASSLGTSLKLLGTKADPGLGRRDASRLLARASLMVQQVVGIVTEPVLVAAGPEGVLEAARDAGLIVVGLSERWRTESLGRARLEVVLGADVPTLFVRRGLRPGGLAPNETLTRFSWTLGSSEALEGAGR